MTGQQKVAFTHPCYEAEECSHRRYGRMGEVMGLVYSLFLTLNIGLE